MRRSARTASRLSSTQRLMSLFFHSPRQTPLCIKYKPHICIYKSGVGCSSGWGCVSRVILVCWSIEGMKFTYVAPHCPARAAIWKSTHSLFFTGVLYIYMFISLQKHGPIMRLHNKPTRLCSNWAPLSPCICPIPKIVTKLKCSLLKTKSDETY